ncbi:MAG: hypothetical protein U0Q19_18975 [Kineosporiaceae bacterium]
MRLLPRRRPTMPDDARQAVGLEPGERVLAWSELVGGGYAAATAARLHVLTPYGKRFIRTWVEVDHATWDDESRTLAVWWVGSRQAVGLEPVEASFLPEAVYERLRSSMVLTREIGLPGGRRATVALRRDATGAVTCQSKLPAGVSPDDPAVAATLRAAEAGLREEAGLDSAQAGAPSPVWGIGD